MSHVPDNIVYEGKTKIVSHGPDEESLILHYKDTVTAFDGAKSEELEGKGKLNAAISHKVYTYLTQQGIETHLIEIIDDTSVLVKKAEIIMVEVIVRNVAAGSFSRKYGIPEGTPLKNMVVEFSLKNDQLGDPMINESQVTALGLATMEELTEMAQQARRINELLRDYFSRTGIRLVDFKLEFGRYGGKILLCDEVSPDSCRLWDMETNDRLDKDRFRGDCDNVLAGYQDVLGRLKNV